MMITIVCIVTMVGVDYNYCVYSYYDDYYYNCVYSYYDEGWTIIIVCIVTMMITRGGL